MVLLTTLLIQNLITITGINTIQLPINSIIILELMVTLEGISVILLSTSPVESEELKLHGIDTTHLLSTRLEMLKLAMILPRVSGISECQESRIHISLQVSTGILELGCTPTTIIEFTTPPMSIITMVNSSSTLLQETSDHLTKVSALIVNITLQINGFTNTNDIPMDTINSRGRVYMQKQGRQQISCSSNFILLMILVKLRLSLLFHLQPQFLPQQLLITAFFVLFKRLKSNLSSMEVDIMLLVHMQEESLQSEHLLEDCSRIINIF